MDWASSQWKEGLPSVALQKVNALEEKVEKLQKERQQKQLQFECLELTLNKEKRKVDEEKQQTVRLERELQSLADVCKNLENKQQKLQADIQYRDSRLNNLEAQLAQAKKQTSRLQQLESDIEDLRCLRDNSKLENKELEEKLKKEHSTIVKQTDAICDLEQTIKNLQEKCSNNSKSLIISDFDKENVNNVLTESNTDHSINSELLRKKILEQENLIKSLRAQLTNVSESKEKVPVSSGSFKTPVKTQNILTETPLSSAKKPYSFWDSFGSTPKEVKVAKHLNESSTFDSESDEKVRTLQQKLKQVCQELECQRHNSEAAKNAMEQRLKEKENSLKTEVKLQAQTITDQDKELKEIKNKYQQDVVQTNKKLDVVNMQLQKSEQSKQRMEKDFKTLESQLNSSNLLIEQKTEELKDLQKQKNCAEAITKSLQCEKRDLEKSCSVLQNEKRTLHEEIKSLKVQLNGSNNLVKEKDISIQNLKKEHDNSSKMNAELQMKLHAVNKDLSTVHSERNRLEKQLQDLNANYLAAKENLESLNAEKKSICGSLDLEKCKTGKLENDIAGKKKEILNLQSEIKCNEQSVTSLKDELDELKNNCNAKIINFEQELSRSKEENSQFKKQIQASSDKEKDLLQNMGQMKKEYDEISNLLSAKTTEFESLVQKIKNLETQLLSLQKDNESKDKNIRTLTDEIKSLKNTNETKIINFEQELIRSKEENSQLKKEIQASSDKEKDLQQNMGQMKKENDEISNLLSAKTTEFESLVQKIKNLEPHLLSLQKDNESKDKNIQTLTDEIKSFKKTNETKIINFEQELSRSKEENSQLKKEIQASSDKEKDLQQNMDQMKKEKDEISNLLSAKTTEFESLVQKIKNLEPQLLSLQKDNESKDKNIQTLTDEIKSLKNTNEAKIINFEQELSKSKEENSQLKKEIQASSDKEKDLQQNMGQMKKENDEISSLLSTKTTEFESLVQKIKNLEPQLLSLQKDNESKDKNIQALTNEIKSLKHFNEAQIINFEQELSRSKEENSQLKKEIQVSSDIEKDLQQNMDQIKKENYEISNLLSTQTTEFESLVQKIKNLEPQLLCLQEDNKSKDKNIQALTNEIKSSKDSNEIKLQELENTISKITAENSCLQNLLNDISTKEALMKKDRENLEKEVKRISNLLNISTDEKQAAETKVEEVQSKLARLQSDNDSKARSIVILKEELKSTKETFDVKVKDLQQCVDFSNAENIKFKDQLNELISRETSLGKTLEQERQEKKNTSDMLVAKTGEAEKLLSNLEQSKIQMHQLQSDNDSKLDIISSMKKETESLKKQYDIKIIELQCCIDLINTENGKFKEQLNECASKEVSINKTLEQEKSEKKAISDMLTAEMEELQKLQLDLKDSKVQMLQLQADYNTKEEIILGMKKEIESYKKQYDTEVRELQQSIDLSNAENANLKEQLNKLVLNEVPMTRALEQEIEEKKNISDMLAAKGEEAQKLLFDLEQSKVQMLQLQADYSLKEEIISSMEKETESMKAEYNNKIVDLQQCLSTVQVERNALDSQVQKLSSEQKSLQENMIHVEFQNKKLSDSLCSEIEKTKMLDTSIDDLNANLQALQSNFKHEKESLESLETNYFVLKESYEKEQTVYSSCIESIMPTMEKMLENANEIYAKNENIGKEMQTIKDDYQKSQLLDANDQEVKLEFLYNLLNQLDSIERFTEVMSKDYDQTVEDLQKQLSVTVIEKHNIISQYDALLDDKLSVEERLLESQGEIMKLEQNMSDLNVLKDGMSQLSKKIELLHLQKLEMTRVHEQQILDIKSLHQQTVEDLQKQLSDTVNEKFKICSQYDALLSGKLNVEEQLLASQGEIMKLEQSMRDLNVLKDDGMNQLSKEIEMLHLQKLEMTQVHEQQILDIKSLHQQTFEDLQKQLNDTVIEKFEICSQYDALLAGKLNVQEQLLESQGEIMKLEQSMSDLNVLKDEVSQLSKEIEMLHLQKQEMTQVHEQQILDLKRHHQEEKSAFIIMIENIESTLKPMCNSFMDLCIKSEFVEDEMKSIQGEHEKYLMKNEKTKKEFLFDLLKRLDLIEERTEIMSKYHKQTIKDLQNQLSVTVIEKCNICSQYDAIKLDKLSIEERLLESQGEIMKLEQSVSDLNVLKDGMSQLSKEIKMLHLQKLEMTQVHEQQILDIKSLHQQAVEDLQKQLNGTVVAKHNISSQYDALLAGKLSVEEQLLESQGKIMKLEQCLSDLNVLKDEMSQLSKDIEMLHLQKLEMTRVHEEQILDIKSLHQKSINDLERQLNQARIENSELGLKCDVLLTEKSSVENNLVKYQEKFKELEQRFSESTVCQVALDNMIKKIEELDVQNLEMARIYKLQLNELKREHQIQISSLSQELEASSERLGFIDTKFHNIASNCENAISSIQKIQERSVNISEDLHILKHDHCYAKSNLEKEGQVKEICDLFLHNIDLFEEFLAQYNIIEIPTEVVDIGNDVYLKRNSSGKESCCGNILYNFTDGQEMATNLGSEVRSLCLELWGKLCAFEDSILSHKEHLDFLLSHQLINETDFKKVKNSLKFMKNAYTETFQKKSALIPLKVNENYLTFSENHLSQELLCSINLLSNNCSDANISLFFEKSLLINSYRNLYMMTKLKKVLHSVNRGLTVNDLQFEQHMKKFYCYQNIHSHHSHLPIVIHSDYFIYMHNINAPLYKKETFCFQETFEDLMTHFKHLPHIENVLHSVISAKMPLLLNCLYKFSESNLLTNLSDCSLKKLIFCVLETLLSSYKDTSTPSCEAVRNFENFLLYISENIHVLKTGIFKDNCRALGDIVFNLLQNLALQNSHVVVEYCSQGRQLLNEDVDKIKELKLECENNQYELMTLHAKLQGLTAHTESIESNLNMMMLQKENWKKKMTEVGKFCSALKIVFSDNCDISKLQSEIANLSNTLCVCQDCLSADGELVDYNDKNHIPLTPMNVIHHVAMLFTTKVDFEKKIFDLKANELSLNKDIGVLENEKAVLSQTVNDLEKIKNLSDEELNDLKAKYASLEKKYQNSNLLISESNLVQESQLKSIEIHLEELNKCKDEYQELYCENQKLKNDLIQKREEISHFENIIAENISESKTLSVKCNDYQLEINKLNGTVSKLLADLKETKDEASAKVMSNVDKLKDKIASLEKSKNLLNITLENVEEELQIMYAEKQEIEEKLQKKIKEIECLKQEITSWKDKVAEKEGKVSSLEFFVKELESSAQDSDKKYADLLSKNSTLEKDINALKREQKEHQVVLLEKNFCLKHKDSMISQLKENMLKNLDEKEKLEMNLASIKTNLSHELEVKVKLLYDTEKKLNAALKLKLELEKQIEDFEFENKKLKDGSDTKLKYQKLTSENCSLKEEIEKLLQEKLQLKKHAQSLNDKAVAAETNVIQLQEALKTEKEKYNESVNALQKAINSKEQSDYQNSQMIQDLQQRADELEKEILRNIQAAKKKEVELSLENSDLHEKLNTLINQSKPVCDSKNAVTDTVNLEPVHNYKLFIVRINNLLCDVLKSVECNGSDCNERKELLSILTNLTRDTEDSNFTLEVYEKVQLFLKNQYCKQKELEFQICGLTKSICNSIMQIVQYCELVDSKYNSQIDAFVNMDKSCLDVSVFASAAADFSLSNLTDELQKSFKKLDQCFSLMKDDICRKEIEIKTLQQDLDEAKSRLNPRKSKASDIQALESKCSLLKLNEHRLKEKHNKLLKTCEGMEARIKQLEKENLELDTEANELAEEIKRQTTSDELCETYKKLSETITELRQMKKENKCLKSTLEQCHSFYQQQSINSNVCDSSTRDQEENPQS